MKKINLLFDLSYIRAVPSSVISVHLYFARLIKGFEEREIFHVILLVVNGMEKYIDSLVGFEVEKIVIKGNDKVTFSLKLDRFIGVIPFEKQLQQKEISAVLCPELIPYIYSYPRKYNQHIIVHDLIRIHWPNHTNVFFYSLMIKWLTRAPCHLISISQATRMNLKNKLGRDSDVIYNSIPFDFQIEEVPVIEVKDKRYILDVNRFEVHKNASCLIMAFYAIKDKIPHILYLKGVNGKNSNIDELKYLISKFELENRVVIDSSYRSEGEMRYLYTHADLFVTPSLEEGFGYTPIEAAILKTPVLISDIPVLKEVTQGKIETFNPHSPEELAEKMLRIISAPPQVEKRITLSKFYLNEYSLERQIERFTEVILNNISSKGQE